MRPPDEALRDLDRLLPEERTELRDLFLNWQTARREKDWAEADTLRALIEEWDSLLGRDGEWMPAFESPGHRRRRAMRRMTRYGVEIYPYSDIK